jgi:hypothetical protein
MSLPARKLQAEEFMAERTVLDEKVDHIQSDVSEMKKDIRRLDDKIDAVRREILDVRVKIGNVRVDMAQRSSNG